MRVRRVSSIATAVAMLLCARAGRAEDGGRDAGGSGTAERTPELVVTGSRIRGIESATASPMIVLDREQIVASGKASLGELLQMLVVQGNAPSNAVASGGDGSTRVNLRGLGVSRTLVLVNGRRWAPGGNGADASVDLSLLPSAAVERIEVLTDAASAVYGSDAIAGVVNVITRREARETRAAVYTGASGHGDGTTLDLNLTSGIGGGRGGLLLAAGYSDERKVPAANRGFSRFQWYYDSVRGRYSVGSGVIPAGVTLRDGLPGLGNALWNTLVTSGASAYVPTAPDDPAALGCGPSASGQTACFRPYLGSGLPAAGDVAVGDGYNFAADGDVVTPQRRIELFTTGDLRLGSAARAFVEASWVNRRSDQERAPELLFPFGSFLSVSQDNVYNPFGKDVEVRRRLVELGRRVTREDVDAFRVVGGLDGTAPDALGPLAGWSWDVSLDWARTSSALAREGGFYEPAVGLALGPSFINADTKAQCGTAMNPIPLTDCVPLNLFGGPGSITPDQVAAIAYTATAAGTNELRSFQASASGALFRLAPDRAASLAVGYEHRRLSGAFVNDAITAQGLGSGARGLDTRGAYHVNELHAEVAVPIARGLPAADELQATGALRWSGYSTSGGAVTYALGTRWRPIPDVTLRATYSTAFRAPSIVESFGPQQDQFPTVRDPCRGPTVGGPPPSQACLDAGVPAVGSGDASTMLHAVVGGNPDVGPETARVATAGVVLEPRGLPNLSVALGAYSMEIDGIIGPYGANVLLTGCYSGAHPEYCSHVVRDPSTHFIDVISDLNDNSGKLSTAGLDASLRYAVRARRLGRFALAIDATWLQRIDQTLPDGTVVHGKDTFDLTILNGNAGAGGTFPAWKANAGVTWGLGGLGAGISTRFLGSFHECGSPYDSNGDGVADAGVFDGSGRCFEDSRFQRQVAAWHAEDAFVSYAFRSSAGRTHVMLGVRNLGDVPPATIYNGFASATDQYTYDQMGRFFYVRLEQAY